jgi:hypothetical protein
MWKAKTQKNSEILNLSVIFSIFETDAAGCKGILDKKKRFFFVFQFNGLYPKMFRKNKLFDSQ